MTPSRPRFSFFPPFRPARVSPSSASSRITSRQIAAAGWPPSSRAKDIRCHPFFRGEISRWTWRFYTHRLTPAGRWFLCLTILFMMFGTNSLDLLIYVPFMYSFGVWFVAVACVFWLKPRVRLAAHHADRIRAGETLPIEVEVRQGRRWPGVPMTLIPHGLPPDLDAAPEAGTRIPPLRRGQKARVQTAIRCPKRGMQRWQGFRVECDFPFGLLRAYRTYAASHHVLVYPAFTPLARLQIPVSLRYQPGGVVYASTLAESLEYIGNREYREGDNIRDIDWRATARLNTPIVREYREEYFLRVGVILDTRLPAPPRGVWTRPRDRQAQEENFERAVSLAAAVSDYMARQDYIVDIFAAGPMLYHLTAGRSLAYLEQILDILAAVEHSNEEPFDAIEPEIAAHLAQITTLACVFLDWNEARQAFVRRLQREGAGVKVIVVRDEPCTLDPSAADVPGGIVVLSKDDFAGGIEAI